MASNTVGLRLASSLLYIFTSWTSFRGSHVARFQQQNAVMAHSGAKQQGRGVQEAARQV